MDSSSVTTITKPARSRGWPVLLLMMAVGPMLYGAGMGAALLGNRLPVAVLIKTVAAVVTPVGAILLLWVVPWLLGTLAFRRIESRRATAGAWSLAANSAALILVCLILRNTVGIGRGGFLASWLVWTVVLSILACERGQCVAELRGLWRRWGLGLMIGVAAVTAAVVLFQREHFAQCFNGDGIETFELARSLQHHLLPYWEMEWVGRFGTDVTNPSLINSYWTCALQLLLGETELATRLPYWVWWLGIFATALHMVSPGRDWGLGIRDWPNPPIPNSQSPITNPQSPIPNPQSPITTNWPAAIPLALMMLLACLWYTFYVGWNPYLVDPANPGVTDALFTLCLLLALDCLRLKDLSGWVVLTVLGSLVLYAGPVMFVLTSIAAVIAQPVPRRQMLGAVLAGTAALSALVLFYVTWGWLDGSLPGWWPTLYADYVDCYIRPLPRWNSGMLFAGYFLLGCGGIPAIGLLLPFRKKSPGNKSSSDVGWERTVAAVTLWYLLIVLGGGIKNLHYLGPLMPIPVILWLRCARRAPSAMKKWAASAAAPLLVGIWLCWPVSRPLFSFHHPVFTLHRELGAVTTFQTDSYQEACRWLRAAEVTITLYKDEHFGWYIGQHTWVHYSQLAAEPAVPRPLLITDRAAPSDEYQLVLEWGRGVRLYCRDPQLLRWAARQQPPSGPDRCPWVFRPIAIAPFARSSD